MIDVQASRRFDQPAEQLWSLVYRDGCRRSKPATAGPAPGHEDARERPPERSGQTPRVLLEAVNPWDCPPGIGGVRRWLIEPSTFVGITQERLR